MTGIRVTNDTDETIVIEPGESLDMKGEEDTVRLMASRAKRFSIEGVER